MDHTENNTGVDVHTNPHPVQLDDRERRIQERVAGLKALITAQARDAALEAGKSTDDGVVMMEQLERVGRYLDAAAVELEALKRVRDELVVEASERGFSRRYVAVATFLTPGRVQQIVDANR